jgi:hypothetical protein
MIVVHYEQHWNYCLNFIVKWFVSAKYFFGLFLFWFVFLELKVPRKKNNNKKLLLFYFYSNKKLDDDDTSIRRRDNVK